MYHSFLYYQLEVDYLKMFSEKKSDRLSNSSKNKKDTNTICFVLNNIPKFDKILTEYKNMISILVS